MLAGVRAEVESLRELLGTARGRETAERDLLRQEISRHAAAARQHFLLQRRCSDLELRLARAANLAGARHARTTEAEQRRDRCSRASCEARAVAHALECERKHLAESLVCIEQAQAEHSAKAEHFARAQAGDKPQRLRDLQERSRVLETAVARQLQAIEVAATQRASIVDVHIAAASADARAFGARCRAHGERAAQLRRDVRSLRQQHGSVQQQVERARRGRQLAAQQQRLGVCGATEAEVVRGSHSMSCA
eukprot:COSAG01_NODE_10241_length_2211_cov_8.304924_2_plen_251_part_00